MVPDTAAHTLSPCRGRRLESNSLGNCTSTPSTAAKRNIASSESLIFSVFVWIGCSTHRYDISRDVLGSGQHEILQLWSRGGPIWIFQWPIPTLILREQGQPMAFDEIQQFNKNKTSINTQYSTCYYE